MNKMKITVRGIKDEMLKEEVKAIIREFCDCESVYAKGFFSGEWQTCYLRCVEIYPTGSKSMIGYIRYNVVLRCPEWYGVVNRRQYVKVYMLRGEA